jgi:uncharacterized protein (TIGR02611 family)
MRPMRPWRKPAVTIGGGIIVLAGAVMLVIPGPGLLTIAAGVAVLATEYVWARRLLERIKARLHRKKVEKSEARKD